MGYRYIGSKVRIADEIMKFIGPPSKSSGFFVDAFCGTGIVSSKAADIGWRVKANDMMTNAVIMSESRLLSCSDVSFAALNGYKNAVSILNEADNCGFIWREYSPASLELVGIERRYFSESNARRIDGATELIHQWYNEKTINDKERDLLLATVISAVNDVANIAGTYGCFLSKWTQQSKTMISYVPLELRENPVCFSVSSLDVFDVKSASKDVVYLDPPYTKRQYASYYHILETIAKGDQPKVEGIAGLRPWKDKASVFCYKSKALNALISLVRSQKAERVVISYSNEGHIQLDELEQELKRTGTVRVIELGTIGKYRPNQKASAKGSEVCEYLIEYSK